MSEPLLVGIDLGTTNAKAACYDVRGALLAEANEEHPTRMPHPGWYEQEPADWISALGKCLRRMASALGDRAADISGLAVSNFGPGLVLLDTAGEPIASSPTWQDERCRDQGKRLLEAVGTDWVGLGPALTGLPAKLLWVADEQPDLLKRAALASDIKGFLHRWLVGQAVTDPSSGPGDLAWHHQVFDYIGWPVRSFHRVAAATTCVGGLRTELAAGVRLKAGLPVFSGVNDGAAATIGSGAVRLGDSIITLATNGVARLVLGRRLDPDVVLNGNLFSWPLVDGLWIGGGFTRSGAGSLRWLADLLGIAHDPAAYDALLAEAAAVPAGSRGVQFLPYLAGRGTPASDPDLRGGFLNVGLEHGRADLARAVLEGVSFALAEIYDEFERLGMHIGPVRVTGGGARSGLWRQIIADTLNREVTRTGADSTLGGAMVAAVGLGLFPNFAAAADAMAHTTAHESPDTARVETYRRLRAEQGALRDRLVSGPAARLPGGPHDREPESGGGADDRTDHDEG